MAAWAGQSGHPSAGHENVVLSTLHEGLGAQPASTSCRRSIRSKWMIRRPGRAYAQKAMRLAIRLGGLRCRKAIDMTQMSPQIARQWASDTCQALALAF